MVFLRKCCFWWRQWKKVGQRKRELYLHHCILMHTWHESPSLWSECMCSTQTTQSTVCRCWLDQCGECCFYPSQRLFYIIIYYSTWMLSMCLCTLYHCVLFYYILFPSSYLHCSWPEHVKWTCNKWWYFVRDRLWWVKLLRVHVLMCCCADAPMFILHRSVHAVTMHTGVYMYELVIFPFVTFYYLVFMFSCPCHCSSHESLECQSTSLLARKAYVPHTDDHWTQ